MIDSTLVRGSASQISPQGYAGKETNLKLNLEFFEGLIQRFNDVKTLSTYSKAYAQGLENVQKVQQKAIQTGDFDNIMSDSIAALEEPINNTDFGLSQSLQVAEWKARDINHLRNKTQAFVITQTTARGVQEAQESLRALSNRAALVPADLNGILEEAENYRRPLEVLTQNPVAVDELLAKTKDNLSAVAIATQASLDPESAELLLSDNEAAISGLQLVSNR